MLNLVMLIKVMNYKMLPVKNWKEIKVKQLLWIAGMLFMLSNAKAQQYKSFKISVKGDTINRVLNDGTKEGKWVISMPELRGEPGYDEEGIYRKGVKEGLWRKYTAQGDLLAVENYLHGGKDGVQQYFTFLGDPLREESWKGYNPDAPFDTIAVYGTGSNEIIDFKIVKAEPYSVKQGEWKYFDPSTGAVIKTEMWELNNLQKPGTPPVSEAVAAKKKEVPKTAAMIEWEKKNRGKKGAVRDGRTGL